jgi:two-component sensor histidine kinase
MFLESQNRVRSMALVHEKLYRSKDLSGIDFYEYVEGLMHELYLSYGLTQGDVALLLDVTREKLPVDIAIPCGLIINELATNSFKYAFKDKKGEGKLGISFKNDDAGMFALEVSDNGPGISPDLDLKKVPTLGLQLVDSLVGQLDASILITGEKGTRVTIQFKK